jgi:uncharacterized protein GlcG (DUF336 family)
MKGAGLPAITSRLEKSFGRIEIRRSAKKYGDRLAQQRQAGELRVRPSGLITTTSAGVSIPQHTFYGL